MNNKEIYHLSVKFIPNSTVTLEGIRDTLISLGTGISLEIKPESCELQIDVPTDKRFSTIDFLMEIATLKTAVMENLSTK